MPWEVTWRNQLILSNAIDLAGREGREQGKSSPECPGSEQHILVELAGLPAVQEGLPRKPQGLVLLLPCAGHWGCRNNLDHPLGEMDTPPLLTQAPGRIRDTQGCRSLRRALTEPGAQGRLPGGGNI